MAISIILYTRSFFCKNFYIFDEINFFQISFHKNVSNFTHIKTLEDLKSPFPKEILNLFNLFILFPNSRNRKDEKLTKSAICELAKNYCNFFGVSSMLLKITLTAELELWKTH